METHRQFDLSEAVHHEGLHTLPGGTAPAYAVYQSKFRCKCNPYCAQTPAVEIAEDSMHGWSDGIVAMPE
jgi:hypothetical protein